MDAEGEEGKLIVYTVKVLGKIVGYTTAYSEDTLTITNTHELFKRYSLEVEKVDAADPDKKLAGAEFTVYADEACTEELGVITTGAKADMVETEVMDRIYAQMATLNKAARDIMVRYSVHSCTDVTGFGLLGHSFEMAQGSHCTIHIEVDKVPYHAEALELASMGLIPAGAYRNREYAENGVSVRGNISRAQQDILYDPQTSGGLLFALPAEEAERCLAELKHSVPNAAIIGYITEKEDSYLVLE